MVGARLAGWQGVARPSAAGSDRDCAVLGANSSARSDIRRQPTGEVDSEHIFGFTEGSDIGAAGESELLADTTGHFGKFSGTYWQTATTLEAKHSLTESFRVSATATFSYFDLSGLRDLDDRRKGAFQSLSFSTRYRLLDREHAPIGLTFGVEPHWGFVDDLSGAPASQLGAEFLVLMDRELIPGRLLGAVNLSYEPEQIRPRGVAEVTRDSTLESGRCVGCAGGIGRLYRSRGALFAPLRWVRLQRNPGPSALCGADRLRHVWQ